MQYVAERMSREIELTTIGNKARVTMGLTLNGEVPEGYAHLGPRWVFVAAPG
jgi:hypothetical protein